MDSRTKYKKQNYKALIKYHIKISSQHQYRKIIFLGKYKGKDR